MLEQHIRSTQRIALVIFAALVMSVFIHVGIVFMTVQPDAQPLPDMGTLQLALTLAAIMSGGTSMLLPRFLLSENRLRALLNDPLDLERLARDQQGNVNATRLQALQQLDAISQRLMLVAQRWMPALILGLALAESVAVFGLMLSLITHDARQIIPFAAAALALMASHFPRLPALIERATGVLQRP